MDEGKTAGSAWMKVSVEAAACCSAPRSAGWRVQAWSRLSFTLVGAWVLFGLMLPKSAGGGAEGRVLVSHQTLGWSKGPGACHTASSDVEVAGNRRDDRLFLRAHLNTGPT